MVICLSSPCGTNRLRPWGIRPGKRSCKTVTSTRKCAAETKSTGKMGDDLLVIKPSNDVPLFTRRASGFCTSSVAIAWFLRNQTAFAEVACVDLKDGPRGIQYCDVVVGKGPMPFEGDVIKCNYEAKLVETGQVVDSAKFFVFGLGNGEVIQGWDLGIGGAEEMPAMAVGGTRKLVVPAELAYGAGGAGCNKSADACVVPPNASMEFTIQLVGIK